MNEVFQWTSMDIEILHVTMFIMLFSKAKKLLS